MPLRRVQLSAISLATLTLLCDGRAMYDFPMELRKRNYVRLSTEQCEECVTMEDFYAGNPFVFVLFYERALMGGNKYKEAVVKGWMESCKELRWSRIACGLVDMVTDKPYAERYIDPKTAPGHIVVRHGEPIMALKTQVDLLLKRPGDKETMIAHVADLLKDSVTRGNLTLSTQVTGKEALQRLLKKHPKAVVAFTGDEQRVAEVFKAGVQDAVLVQGLNIEVEAASSEAAADAGRKGKGKSDKDRDKERVAFIVAHGPSSFGLSIPKGSIATFVDGALQPGHVSIGADAKLGDKEIVVTIKKLTSGLTLASSKGSTEKKEEL